ncbi:hypothetical protein EV174_005817 [Coemansia sp. RSA 2320]|nr:hypothetical protein EV174_005817 [Coemansia sp. RSA 2320]
MEASSTLERAEHAMLGYSGGDVDRDDDVDAFTCRLGGAAVWLDSSSAIPDHSSIVCEQCGSEMVMLTQTYAPLDNSPYERVLYVWACNRRACTGKPGAARVVRAHLLNKEYATKLSKRKKATETKPPKGQREAPATKCSLFNRAGTGTAQLDFGSVWRTGASALTTAEGAGLFTGPIFGQKPQSSATSQQSADEPSEPLPMRFGGADQMRDLNQRLDKLNVSSSLKSEPPLEPAWLSHGTERTEWPEAAGCVPAQHLEFEKEQLKGDRIQERYQAEIQLALEKANDDTAGYNGSGHGRKAAKVADVDAGSEWAGEKYERATRPKGTDAAFEHFAYIAGQNPEQVMRYRFGGQPLLYTAQDETARLLSAGAGPAHPMERGTGRAHVSSLIDGRDDSFDEDGGDEEDDDDDDEDSAGARQRMRVYSTAGLPKCPRCNGKRVFEFQLMPALLSVLPLSSHVPAAPVHGGGPPLPSTERLVGGRLLQTLDLGMEFGTMLVFVCENDCHNGKTGAEHLDLGFGSIGAHAGAAYFDELVLVQTESHSD